MVPFLLPFFEWSDNSFLGAWIRSKTWVFPVIETVHILALTVLLAGIIVIDLRLMGLMMRRMTVSGLTRELKPFINWSIAIILTTGAALYSSEALKCFDNPAFWFKMTFLFLALIFQFTLYRSTTKTEQTTPGKGWTVGILSLILWFAVGWGGRGIGFI
ncbi:MAG TPA: DUF6644 family protein [Bryobacteraceae bacterium]|nr:DUF6644 family protein [Bryobacteraceae bacterium]